MTNKSVHVYLKEACIPCFNNSSDFFCKERGRRVYSLLKQSFKILYNRIPVLRSVDFLRSIVYCKLSLFEILLRGDFYIKAGSVVYRKTGQCETFILVINV